jgi:SPP1 family predicted phage head-tail adaptor
MNVRLSKRCRIEHKSVTDDATYGTESITWMPLAVVWCEVQDVLPSRSETQENGIDIAKQPARWRARHRTDIDSSMRIVIDGAVYQIVSGPASIDNKKYIECMIEKYST